ncbi:ABC transporter substrate-binding protein [Selenomonas sputigena]|uniref:Extracellular ligand-binding receptor n=1 Tax=Selenomonas sputigena (strain ATCC 35185 / DSM 20758 / CCUG 44933 / VPI D19B-28) TaxID=546271 RepID=C9LXK3_SELS3|nr:ABC transporter substrate-binding protein [Selenomonas sputigena]AEB99451.1 Extracellular ligand-binding receptor [Selenomonas sputigena ATCC 35185]EEX76386.1 receptor family ligand-binding protein [Selenomonas sputigena ATCC 35185]
MIFSKKSLRLACAVLGATLLGSVFAGCGSKESGDTIKVGANFELTGNVANYGNATIEGLQLAIDEANEAGGINGKKIELVSVDDKSEAAESINAATKLISDDDVKVIVGPATTGLVLAETQTATDAKVPIIAPCATSPEATVENGKVKPYVFRSCFIDPQQGEVMATFAAKELKAKTAVIYVDNSSDYSKNLAKVFKEKFEAAGGKVVMEEAFLQKDQDFKATLTKLKTANADVMFVPAYYEEVGKIVKQAREMGINSAILGTDGWDDTKVVDIAGADALNNTFFSTHYSEKDAEVQGFIEAYKKKYNRAPNVFAALGYDAGKMLVDALKRAGSGDTEKIREALEATKDLKVGTGTISMDKNHNPIKTAVILEMKNGEKELKAKIAPEGN